MPHVLAARGRGRGGAHDTARADVREAVVEPLVATIEEYEPNHIEQEEPTRAPEGPTATPGLQENLAHLMSMFESLAHASLITVVLATSQAGGGAQLPLHIHQSS